MAQQQELVSAAEILELSARDNDFYCRHFFPKAFRQEQAPFHPHVWEALETPGLRNIACEMFRGAGKTTLLRSFASKRVAFGSSRTILYVSATQDHAKRSVRWLRNNVLYNKKWTNFFRLKLGTKQTDEWLEIVNETTGFTISIIAVGMTGQLRGLNLDDYRPDLIIADDPCDEENTATADQRKKTEDLFFGALGKSLSPPTEAEDAKFVLLQTSLNEFDLINECHSDPNWKTFKFSCFTPEEQSTWPNRFPTEFLLKDKEAHRAKNRLPLWYREMECKIIAGESADFRPEWIKEWPGGILPEGGIHFLYIDPVPPPSQREINMGFVSKDYEVLSVVKYHEGSFYLCEQAINKGHTPEWTVMKFWYLVDRWNVFIWEAEPVNYQRTLKWLIEKSMEKRGRYIQVHDPLKADRRNKRYKILDTLTGPMSQGRVFFNRVEHKMCVEQIVNYPNVGNDDAIESFAGAMKLAIEFGPNMELDFEFNTINQEYGAVEHQPSKALGYCP